MLRTVSEQSGLVAILTMPVAIWASRRIYNPPMGMVREAGLLAHINIRSISPSRPSGRQR